MFRRGVCSYGLGCRFSSCSIFRSTSRRPRILCESFLNQRFITLRSQDGVKDQEITGIITRIDQQLRKIKISCTEGFEWIPLDDILNIQFQID
ncbi:YolD-like family protein [Paenibacillus gyeongsangnamensis]|uniref:YolD-like family protein n=1 Tax=Paenibacillus gyeongsangnamensis TaxID=3388067 RepID=UPI003907EDB6